jgi:hypothetical protein
VEGSIAACFGRKPWSNTITAAAATVTDEAKFSRA